MNDSVFQIWPPSEVLYIQCMLTCSKSALNSSVVISDIARHVDETGPESVEDIDISEALDEIQNIVSNAAALSRYFWPSKSRYNSRGERLREAFSVNEASAIKSRRLRNTIEHFDENLDDHILRGLVGVVFPEYFGFEPVDDGIPRHIFRSYFIDTGIFEILGQQFEIKPIVEEVLRIHNILVEKNESGGRF